MSKEKKYWKGIEELHETSSFVQVRDKEFSSEIPIDEMLGRSRRNASSTSRRDFLKLMGFSIAAASLAACEAPVVKSIPYIIKPEEVTPGIDNWYASTYFDSHDYCSILVKTRDGRPIKIEGNTLSPVTKGAANARVQASVLSLYDDARAKTPYINGKPATWSNADMNIMAQLSETVSKNGNIRILTSTIISPSTHKVISGFIEKYPTAKHITWDSVSFSGMRKANLQTFGKTIIPSYSFDKANVIVSLGADFLTNWLSPIEFAKQYSTGRKVSREKQTMSRHIQFESIMTVSGANADMRIPIKPSEEGKTAVELYKAVEKLLGIKGGLGLDITPINPVITKVAEELCQNKGKSLVIAGSNDFSIQVVVNGINKLLDNYGKTIDTERSCNLRQGNDEEFGNLVDEMKNSKVAVLITYNCNPVYNAPSALDFAGAYSKVPFRIAISDRMDETASLADYFCPDHHYLESWNDAEPYRDSFSLTQPAIYPLFVPKQNGNTWLDGTRSAQDSFLKWTNNTITDYHTFIQDYWKNNILPVQSDEGGGYLFTDLWNKTLQKGVFEKPMENGAENATAVSTNNSDVTLPVSGEMSETAFNNAVVIAGNKINSYSPNNGVEVILYEKTSMGNGNQANNPWLQELPDPISKVTWDNYITMNPSEMREQNFSMLEEDNHVASVATLTYGGKSIELPVFPQPGQMRGTVGIALGYGRTKAGKVAAGKEGKGIGVNIFPWVKWMDNSCKYSLEGATLTSAGKSYSIGATQTHNTMIGRPILKEATLEDYKKDARAGNETERIKTPDGEMELQNVNLWDDYDKKETVNRIDNAGNQGLRWKMAVDLNSCIGCGACVVSCTAENNVPVVGKDEILLTREMHWIRIDRYYSSDLTMEEAKKEDMTESNRMYAMMVPSAENPEVAFQPVMCQHCNHAPCETVCPVIATSHGSEGINQMIYNRCVGTKYCANNCPYKVRRFNWFNYYRDEKFLDINPAQESNEMGRMVLNPDVVVRSRGVMEKCSFCLQRVQAGKLKAKLDSRPLKDGEIVPACAQSCPTQALVFGNVNDPESKVAKLIKDERGYLLLADLDTQPNVFYLTKIRNKDKIILE